MTRPTPRPDGCRGGAGRLADDSCGRPVDPSSPVPLCDRHLAVAADWVASLEGSGEGVTDVLPSPCLACGSRLGVHWPSGWLCAVCEWRHGDVPDGELGVVRVDVVYYIRFDDRIKIGTSSNPRQRLGTLWHDELLAFEPGDRLVERRRHGQFAASRFGRTEWFARSAELDTHVAALALGVDDPWQRYARWRSEALALRG